MTAAGLYEPGTDDKCALFLRINDWQDDIVKHAPPAGGDRVKVAKIVHVPGRRPGRPRKDASKGLSIIKEND
jgi:hypothetical protein